MDHLGLGFWGCGLVCYQAFCAPGDVVYPADSVDVEDVDIGRTVEYEWKCAPQDIEQVLEPAINWEYQNRHNIESDHHQEQVSKDIGGMSVVLWIPEYYYVKDCFTWCIGVL